MAMESMPLRDALLAFAAGHLSLTEQSYQLTALEARSKAIQSLAGSINTISTDIGHYEANAAACLTFLLHDVGVDADGDWRAHLEAAQHIIMSAKTISSSGRPLEGPEAFKTSSEGQWILRNFAYHDIIGSITLRQRPLLGGSYLIDIANVVDSYIGVATDLLVLAADVSRIEEETRVDQGTPREAARKTISLFHTYCARLEQQLQNWKCEEDTPSELAAVAYAYRSAVLIVLYRLVRSRLRAGYFFTSSAASAARAAHALRAKIGQRVTDVVSHVSEVPVGTTPESPLLFPLFLAGGEATKPIEMDVIRRRLENTLQKRRFQNVSQALEILEELWRRRSTGEEDADWTQILDASGNQLLLT